MSFSTVVDWLSSRCEHCGVRLESGFGLHFGCLGRKQVRDVHASMAVGIVPGKVGWCRKRKSQNRSATTPTSYLHANGQVVKQMSREADLTLLQSGHVAWRRRSYRMAWIKRLSLPQCPTPKSRTALFASSIAFQPKSLKPYSSSVFMTIIAESMFLKYFYRR